MRKLVASLGLLTGLLMLGYSVAIPLQEAAYMPWAYGWASENILLIQFMKCWQEDYGWLTAVGGVMTVISLVLLWVFRRSETAVSAFPAAAIGGGWLLEVVAFLQSWTAALTLCQLGLDSILSSGTTENRIRLQDGAWIYSTALSSVDSCSHWNHMGEAVAEYAWLFIPGAVFMLIGILYLIAKKRKEKRNAAVEHRLEETAEPETEVPVKRLEREEWRITLFCTVIDIRGDYALVKYDDTGVESEVAIALLPFGVDTGDRLKYENYEFTMA